MKILKRLDASTGALRSTSSVLYKASYITVASGLQIVMHVLSVLPRLPCQLKPKSPWLVGAELEVPLA
jgi:hypothetical protein